MTTKGQVLNRLMQSGNEFVSGETLSSDFGVSRAAVWKAIRALRQDGYGIDAVPNRGYHLTEVPDVLDGDSIRTALGEVGKDLTVRVFRSLDSTNNEAKRMAASFPSGTALIVAGEQTAGRGRLGRSFFSPAESGVYFSVLYESGEPLERAVSVTCSASVAVMRAIRTLTGRQVGIKWVNDLFLDGKKICGILTEAVSGVESGRMQNVIVGIGINLKNRDFPPELREVAGAVGENDTRRSELIAAVLRELLPLLQNPSDRSWLTEYREYSIVIGRNVICTRGEEQFFGKATGIDGNGGLMVELPDGTSTVLRTGEISIRTL